MYNLRSNKTCPCRPGSELSKQQHFLFFIFYTILISEHFQCSTDRQYRGLELAAVNRKGGNPKMALEQQGSTFMRFHSSHTNISRKRGVLKSFSHAYFKLAHSSLNPLLITAKITRSHRAYSTYMPYTFQNSHHLLLPTGILKTLFEN